MVISSRLATAIKMLAFKSKNDDLFLKITYWFLEYRTYSGQVCITHYELFLIEQYFILSTVIKKFMLVQLLFFF